MKIITLYLFITLIILAGCKNSSANKEVKSEPEIQQSSETQYLTSDHNVNYEDGEYCASISYYNPDTGNNSDYELTLEIENGELVKIQWPNGGWLDDTHFSPPEVDEDGSCSFTTYDGKEYEIQINGEGSCSYSSSSPEEDDELEQQESEQERESNDENEESEEEISFVFPNLFPAKSFINSPYKIIYTQV